MAFYPCDCKTEECQCAEEHIARLQGQITRAAEALDRSFTHLDWELVSDAYDILTEKQEPEL